jgi:hypothetical protein
MSIRALARANGTGIDTIKSAVLQLEHCGYLMRGAKQKQNPDGTFADYEWITTDPFQNPVTGKTRHGETAHKEEQSSIEEQLDKNNKRIFPQELFDEFWNEFPKKLDKAKAKRAFVSALTRATFEDIIAGAIKYRNDPNRLDEYTKYPATWLNADAWENGPLPERSKKRTGKTDWDELDRWVREQENAAE